MWPTFDTKVQDTVSGRGVFSNALSSTTLRNHRDVRPVLVQLWQDVIFGSELTATPKT